MISGICNSLRFDIVYDKLFKYKKIRVSLAKSFVLNILIICEFWILQQAGFINEYVYRVLLMPLLVISLILNNLWRSDIVKTVLEKNFKKIDKRNSQRIKITMNSGGELTTNNKIGISRNKSKKKNFVPSRIIYSFIHDNIAMIIFYICNWLMIKVLSQYSIVISTLLNSLLTSAYCLEYLLRNSQKLLVLRLEYVEERLVYFIGFGLLITLLGNIMDPILYWGVSEFLLMNLLIISMYTQHTKSSYYIQTFYLQKKILPFITNKILIYSLKYFNKYQ